MDKIQIKRIDQTLITVIDGNVYTKIIGINEDIGAIFEEVAGYDKDELMQFFQAPYTSKEKEKIAEFEEQKERAVELQDVLEFMQDIKENGHDLLTVDGNSIYLAGINISMPELLVKKLASAYADGDSDKVLSYVNFWTLCAMNPDARARHDLFAFLEKGGFSLTHSGYFIAYRNANVKNQGNKILQEFVTQKYLQVKRWKKAPSNYIVYQNIRPWTDKNGDDHQTLLDGLEMKPRGVDPSFEEYKSWGNLEQLYLDISDISETVYTDAHSGSTTIKIGEPVEIPRGKCDANPTNTCSRGLHVATTEFLGTGGYFGTQGLVVLVNPKDVVAVPQEYMWGKMRTCKYLPIALAEYEEDNSIKKVDTATFEFEIQENLKEEMEKISNFTSDQLEEYKKHEFFNVELDFEDFKIASENFSITLKEANDIINNR